MIPPAVPPKAGLHAVDPVFLRWTAELDTEAIEQVKYGLRKGACSSGKKVLTD